MLVQQRGLTGARNVSWTWRRLEQEALLSTFVAEVIIAELVSVAVVVFAVLQTEVNNSAL